MSHSRAQTHTAGILLAGTYAWSNNGFDALLPRTLLPVAHRPLIWYGLSWLHRAGIDQVAVCGNRETRLLQARLERHIPPGAQVSYHEDPMPRGAAGSARDAAAASAADTFVVADGMTIPNIDLEDLLRRHHETGACVTVVVHTEARRHNSAAVMVPSGIYVFARRAFEQVPARGFCDIKEKLIPKLYGAGERIVAYEASAPVPRVLDASTYLAVNEWTIERLAGDDEIPDGYVRSGDALVHREAIVARDASLVGPVLVGPGARIQSGAVVVGPTSIGRDVIVSANALVSRSSLWRRSCIGEGAVVDRCIVADDAVLQPGTQTFRGIAAAAPSGDTPSDWVMQKTAPRREPLERGRRLARLVFGAYRLRPPTAP